jgi:quercetin dioxygenase-like cupin family protein
MSGAPSEPVVVRRAEERFRTDQDGITTFHSFSYGVHYDPDNVGFGPVIALNEENVPPGGGYDSHRHSDVTIFTLVLEGALAHEDSTGRRLVLTPGRLESVSAGAGIEHSERNASDTEPLRFLQLMTREVPVDVGVSIQGVEGGRVRVQAPALVHVTHGEFVLDGTRLGVGDEARLSGDAAYDLSASGPADALIVQMR